MNRICNRSWYMNRDRFKWSHSNFCNDPPSRTLPMSIYICIDANGNLSRVLFSYFTFTFYTGVEQVSHSRQCKCKRSLEEFYWAGLNQNCCETVWSHPCSCIGSICKSGSSEPSFKKHEGGRDFYFIFSFYLINLGPWGRLYFIF